MDDVVSVLNSSAAILNETKVNETVQAVSVVTSTIATTSISSSILTINSTQESIFSTILSNTSYEALVNESMSAKRDSDSSFFNLAIFSSILFLVSVLLVLKIAMSYRRKRSELTTGSPIHWGLLNFYPGRRVQTSQNAAVYTAMPNEGCAFSSMDIPHPDARLDWERQFFDENLLQPPSWNLRQQTTGRLRLDSNRFGM